MSGRDPRQLDAVAYSLADWIYALFVVVRRDRKAFFRKRGNHVTFGPIPISALGESEHGRFANSKRHQISRSSYHKITHRLRVTLPNVLWLDLSDRAIYGFVQAIHE